MEQPDVIRRPGGRSARVREAVLGAALGVLEQGVAGFTIPAVADRAGIHQSSIYRRWGTPEALMVEALLHYSAQQMPVPDTGSLRDDLIKFARLLADYLRSPRGRALVQVAATIELSSTVAELRTKFWADRFDRARVMVSRAIERGELPADADARLIIQTVIAPLHFRILMTGEPIDESLPEQLADAVLHGVVG